MRIAGMCLILAVFAWGLMPCSLACWQGGMRWAFPLTAGAMIGAGIVMIALGRRADDDHLER